MFDSGRSSIGFTGTRDGMSIQQRNTLHRRLFDSELGDFHHGDCKGADEQAHDIAKSLGFRVVIHPPDDVRMRAFTYSDSERYPLPYLVRNKNIVNETKVLYAAPKIAVEELRSGTWATIRYALKIGATVFIILPDGTIA
jgi:hypothetical protein